MSEPTTVFVCRGRECLRHPDRSDDLVEAVAAVAHVITTRCLGVCDGPVVVVDDGGQPVVLRRIRSSKRRSQLRRSARRGRLVSALRSRRVRGKKARRALKRMRRVSVR